MQLDVVPNLWMLHLNRFHVNTTGKSGDRNIYCVSKSLELDGIQSPDQHKFDLLGGILHVSDEDEDDDDDEAEGEPLRCDCSPGRGLVSSGRRETTDWRKRLPCSFSVDMKIQSPREGPT
jgi:hypothetical protein